MSNSFNRRTLIQSAAAASALLLRRPTAFGQQPEVAKKTFVYKQVGDLQINADVYRADDQTLRPVAVWIHGGALINGHRESVSGPVKKAMLDAGCALVSIDYRLAPETRLPAIIEDLEDAFAWIRRDGPKLFHADPSKIAVTGGSAGGYLTLAAGHRVRPRVTVLAAFWGYGDLVGDWYSKPSPHPRHHTTRLSKEEAYAQVSGPPVADSRMRKGDGGAFYQYCRQQGTWPQAVSGWNPHTEAEKFAPYMPVKNVTSDFPPTVLVHGTDDTDVPYEQSKMMAAQFKQHGVEHRLLTIPGAEHGLAGGDPRLIQTAYEETFDFINRHMNAS